jgi:hypothetical protein
MVTNETSLAKDTSKHGRRYSDETKELAFQLWETRCQKSARKVSELLREEQFGSLDISERTILQWSTDDQWDLEAVDRFDSAFPGFNHWLFRSMVYAAAEGIEYWQDVNAGRAEPNKVRMAAITSAFDRIGFSPVGKNVMQPDKPSEHASGPDFDSMSMIEIREYEYSAKKRKRFTPSAPVVNGSRPAPGNQ